MIFCSWSNNRAVKHSSIQREYMPAFWYKVTAFTHDWVQLSAAELPPNRILKKYFQILLR